MTKRDIAARRAVLNAGLLACYEIIDRIRKELVELDIRQGRAPARAFRKKSL